MKGEHAQHSKIAPAKSLVEKSKQHPRKHHIQSAAKYYQPITKETVNAQRHINPNYHHQYMPQPCPHNITPYFHPLGAEQFKEISMDYNYAINGSNLDSQPQQIGKKLQFQMSIKSPMIQNRESFKSVNLHCSFPQVEKEDSNLSDKFIAKLEDETWHASQFQKGMFSEKQSQHIYKNELIKTKTQLFKKEVQLFEASQKLEDRQNKIKELVIQRNFANDLNKTLKELPMQKEEQSLTVTQTIQFYKEQMYRNIQQIQILKHKFNEEVAAKESVIRQLSGDIGDLKSRLKELQIRMREMIENQDQLNKQLQLKQSIITRFEQFSNNHSLKQFELEMVLKTCEEYKRKTEQYHKQQYSQQMKMSLQYYQQRESQLKKILIDQEHQIQRFKARVWQQEDPYRLPSQINFNTLKQGKVDDTDIRKLTQMNLKFIRQNERLKTIIRQIDQKAYQFQRVNKGLNQQIINTHLQQINRYFSQS